MHQKPIALSFLILISTYVFAQKGSIGFSAGGTGFLGDLGGYQSNGRPLYLDLNYQIIRPEIAVRYELQLIKRYKHVLPNQYSHFSLTGQLAALQVAGADSLIHPHEMYSGGWYRWYRNLSFRSTILEATATIVYSFYTPNDFSTNPFFSPYIFIGAGIFYMDPQTSYSGKWVDLHPLHTEGEGFADSLKEYSLIQPVIPLGMGIRFQLNEKSSFFIEFCHRFTFTDYIDDVSKNYISQQDFENYFANDPSKAQLAYSLSNRSIEKNLPENSYITAPGQQRGNPKNNDQYFSLRVGLSFSIFNTANFHTFEGYQE